MIEVSERGEGITVTYTEQRAFDVFGPDVLAEMLCGDHPNLLARRVNGRGKVMMVCPWCDPVNPRVYEERPSQDDADMRSHGICADCHRKMFERDRRVEDRRKEDRRQVEESEAVRVHWIEAQW